MVTREEIQKTLWQGETFVDFDQGLNYCIRQIRIALEDSADQPRFIATIPRRGYQFLPEVSNTPAPRRSTPALEERDKSPTIIPSDAGIATASPGASIKTNGIQRRHLFAGALVLLFMAGLVYYAGWHRRLIRAVVSAGSTTSGHGSSSTPVRTSVAVLGFVNLDGNQNNAWLSTAFSEMLSTELSEGGRLRLVSGEEIAHARPAVPLPESLSTETLQRLRQQLGADLIVLGSYTILPQARSRTIRLDLRLQDARNGQILAAFAQTADEAELFNLVANAGGKLRETLGVAKLSTTQEAAFDHSFPSDPDARRLYAEGLDKLRRLDTLAAKDSLEQAIIVDPRFAPAHSALAAAWSALGYDLKAKEEAKKASDLTASLSREEQLSIEARYYEMAQERPKAAETLRTLVSFFPDDLDYGIRLATVQMLADQNPEALATLAKLRKLPDPLSNNPRLDILESQIVGHQGNFKRALEIAENAVRKSKTIGAQFLLAQSLMLKTSYLERLGSADAALATASEMKQVATDAGISRSVGVSLLLSGDVLYDKGDYSSARERFENALSIFQEIGDRRNQGQSHERIGNVYHDQGKFAQSQNEYTRALDAYREVQWPTGISSATGNLANTLDAMGDLNGSLKMHREALRVFQEIGYKRAIASELNNIATVQQEMGNLKAAAEGHRQALALHKEAGHQRGEMYATAGLGEVLLSQGRLDEARRQYEAARALGAKIEENDETARFDTAIATIDILQQRMAEAEPLLRHAISEFQKDKDPEGSVLAYSQLARILLAQNKRAEAAEAGKQAEAYAGQITSLGPQFELGLVMAELEAGNGKRDAARKRILDLLERARRGGYAQYILELRRELIGLEVGKSREGHLSNLAAEARQKDFGLVILEIRRMASNSGSISEVASR